MSCQLTWNYNEYRFNQRGTGENIVTRTIAPVYLRAIKNDTLKNLRGFLVSDASEIFMNEMELLQFDDTFSFSIENKCIGSIYIVSIIQQFKSDNFQSQLKNVTGTVLSSGIFSRFNNGIGIFEYDNDSGERCLTLYSK
jgi:hypothetical protein